MLQRLRYSDFYSLVWTKLEKQITEQSEHSLTLLELRHSLLFVLAAKSMVNVLVSKLPSDGHQKTPSSEVVVNICGALNHLVTCSSLAARDISYFNGLPKLIGIKTSHDHR